jgi:hypothetical protein
MAGREERCGGPLARRFDPFVSLEHVFDVSLENQKVWGTLAINFQCTAIIPFDCAFDFLAIE